MTVRAIQISRNITSHRKSPCSFPSEQASDLPPALNLYFSYSLILFGLMLFVVCENAVAETPSNSQAAMQVTPIRSFQSTASSTPQLNSSLVVTQEQRKLTPQQRSYRLNEVGVKLILAGEREKGLSKLQRAVEIDAKNTTALYNIAGLYISDGQPERAVETMLKAVAIVPQEISFLNRLAEAHFAASQIKEAIATYEKIVQLSPEHESTLLRLGTLYALEKDWNRAEDRLRKACDVDPKDPIALSNLGNVLVAKEKYSEAMEVLTRAQDLYTPNPDNEMALGVACEALNKSELALQHYLKAKELGSADPNLNEHIKQLEQQLQSRPQ